ncbi:MAG: NusG domain II-containing protein [bacterium]|nr:NusG domain II-containing protein [bacterium]
MLVLLAGITVFSVFRPERTGSDGNRIRISVDGSPKLTLPLGADTVLTVQGIMGNTEIAVSGGGTRVLRSPCPGKNCVHQGEIRNAGRMLICIPNRVTVTVEDSTGGLPEVDGWTP